MNNLMKKQGDCVRQGDVLIVRTTKNELTKAHKPVSLDDGKIVVALGETSLHRHVMRGQGVCLLYAEGISDRVMTVGEQMAELITEGGERGPGLMRHPEIPIPTGTYRVTIQREWVGEEVRNAQD